MEALFVITFFVVAGMYCGVGVLAAHVFEERLKQKIEYDERLKEAAEWFTRHTIDALKQETSNRVYALESEKAAYEKEKAAYLAARAELQQLIERGVWANPNVWLDTASVTHIYDTRAPQMSELENDWQIFIQRNAVSNCQLHVSVAVDILWRTYEDDGYEAFELKRDAEWTWAWFSTDKEELLRCWGQFLGAQYLVSRAKLLTYLNTRRYNDYTKHYVRLKIRYHMQHKKLEDESC